MKKLFISQPMKGLTDEEILNERKRIIEKVQANVNEEVEFIDSFIKGAPHDAKPLWLLGKALELLSTADIVYFGGDWQNYCGCRIENTCAKEYGIETIIEE